MKIKIKADKDLFMRWKNLGWQVTNTSSLVQNDMEMDSLEALVAIGDAQRLINQLEKLVQDTRAHYKEGGM